MLQKGIKINANQFLTFLILGAIFLSALDFINRFFVFVFLAAILLILSPSRRITFDISFLALAVLGICLVAFDTSYQKSILDILKAFPFLLCYLMGGSLYAKRELNDADLPVKEGRVKICVYTVAVGSFAHFALNMLINLDRTDRDVIEFWSRKSLSATGQATLACIMIAVAVAIIFSSEKKLKKLFAFGALAVVVLYNFILAGRTIFVLLAVALVVAYVARNIYLKTNIIKAVLILAVIVVIVIALYSANAFGVKSKYEQSNFYDRFYGDEYSQDIEDDSRMEYKLDYLEHFFDHMMGGGRIHKEVGHHAHDLYLDTYDQASIFALMAILTYIAASLRRVYKCLKSKQISFEAKQLILCSYLIVNVQFWAEPILKGSPWLLAAYCFMDGSLAHFLRETKN